MDEIAAWIARVNAGEPGALDKLFEVAYPELKRLARARLRDGGRGTVLDTVALVNEAYVRIVHGRELRASDRRAFFAYASRTMRSVIVDTVRHRLAERRGGDLERLTLDTVLRDSLRAPEDEPVQVDAALEVLTQVQPRLARVVEMRYFGGYSEPEIADVLGVTERTVRRDWEKARILLKEMLRDDAAAA